jgi:hypothetical protein
LDKCWIRLPEFDEASLKNTDIPRRIFLPESQVREFLAGIRVVINWKPRVCTATSRAIMYEAVQDGAVSDVSDAFETRSEKVVWAGYTEYDMNGPHGRIVRQYNT